MKEPSVDDFVELIKKSSSPLLAFEKILLAFPSERRNSLAAEIHSKCSDLLLKDALRIQKENESPKEK